jgi:hypothetical protein
MLKKRDADMPEPNDWTEPVILTRCGDCEARTKHARRQYADSSGPEPIIVTKRRCSRCGMTTAERTTFPTTDAKAA